MIKEKRVSIRRLEEEDLVNRVKWVNDPEINKTLMFDTPLSLSETKEWYKRNFFNRKRWDFTIIENSSDKPIGMTGLLEISFIHKRAQAYITLGEKSAWGKGYAPEILLLTLDFGFNELGLNKIYLYTLDNNVHARDIYHKFGFQDEAKLIQHYFIHGQMHDLFQHFIIKDDFLEKYGDIIETNT